MQFFPKKTDGVAGYDLYVPDNTLIRKGRNLIKLGIAIQMPSNMKAIIKPRSGFSLKVLLALTGSIMTQMCWMVLLIVTILVVLVL